VVVLDNDLDRRAPALLIDDFLRRRPRTIALATLEDRLTAQADVVLPAATFAESTGTFISHEGRAQRFFSVLPPAGEAMPGWRWLRDLMERLGRKEAHGWRTPDDVLAALEMELPEFRGVTAAAPPAGWRGGGRKVARQPQRWSGRTALDAGRTVYEPAPPSDPDSALAYSLEGLRPLESPAALRARVWSPGWNSVNGLHRFEQELEAVRPAASLGVRLLDAPGRARELPPVAAPPRQTLGDGEFTLVALHRIFGSDDLSMYAPGVAARAPEAFIGLNEQDAARLGLREGDWLELWLPWMDTRARCALVQSLVTGTAGVPVGLRGLPYISLPARARLARAEGPA
jgi:NADH-quinone oxidoreductase subunit G